MENQTPADQHPPTREPMFNAPWIVLAIAVLLVALHGMTYFMDNEAWHWMMIDYASDPRRFWADADSNIAYTSQAAKYLTLISPALLHADWLHVLVNSAMLVAFGTPIARAFGSDIAGIGKWMLLFVGSVAGGSILFLLLEINGTIPAIGASGGTSGLMAAAMLVGPYGLALSPFNQRFISFTIMFGLFNAMLAFVGPALFGAGIAWQAHLGGFVAGAILMLLLARRVPKSHHIG